MKVFGMIFVSMIGLSSIAFGADSCWTHDGKAAASTTKEECLKTHGNTWATPKTEATHVDTKGTTHETPKTAEAPKK